MTIETLETDAISEATGEKIVSPFNDAVASAQARIGRSARAAQKAIQENEAVATAQARLTEAARAAQKAIQESEALTAAQAKLVETAKAAQMAMKGHADTLLEKTKDYRASAGAQVGDAQKKLVEGIKARPMTATLAGLGVGLLLGLLLSNRDR